jgi:hypothetical protein
MVVEDKRKTTKEKKKKEEEKKGGIFWSLNERWASVKKNKITHLNVWFGLG